MKNILAVDTASSLMSLSLKKDGSWFEQTIDDGLKHSETLMNTIIGLLKQAELDRNELDLLVCSEGPGSFTGLRIGMSTVKGLAFGLGIPYTAVVTTDYLAAGYDYFPGAVVPVLDARKKRFFSAVYHKGKQISPARDLTKEEIFDLVKVYDRVLFTGPDCTMFDSAEGKGFCIDGNGRNGRSRQLLEQGLKRFESEGCLSEDYGPLYLRQSEAEIALYGEKR